MGLLLVGIVSAGAFSVAIDAPTESEVGDTVSINATVEAGDQLRGDEQNVSVDLLVDGDVVATKHTIVERDNSLTVTFAYQFDKTGEQNVTVVAEGTRRGSSESSADTAIVTVTERNTAGSIGEPEGTTTEAESAYQQCLNRADGNLTQIEIKCDWKHDRGWFDSFDFEFPDLKEKLRSIFDDL